jgi:2OG-Fe(II) oxygenase superfamily
MATALRYAAGAMATPATNLREGATVDAWWFDRDAMIALGRAHQATYAAAQPYPHAVIDGLLGDTRSLAIARAFPDPSHPGWKRRDYAEQAARLGQLARTGFGDVAPELRWLLSELCGMAVLDFLAALTGRRDLIADPHYTGAGPLATLPGGHLALHTDFNRDSARHLDRVISVLYYAPREWDASWGGELELWDRVRTRCEVAIAPVRDRLVVMAYGDDHWHGHPAPLRCPEGHMRAVVAAHFYAARSRPEDDAGTHGAVWA